ncbi:hypothetical protein GGI25_000230 [Coemansia spiralis]|uniref:Uncharacterized protein n=1 Tax=Coemansia spiralis TaxID=417178 RepID=A0A9W8G7T2_9FUNG|nr:hypothetical protein BX070DRAFT_253834 [Coemansia spiralis]KAJ2625803.1 hypothetical protein GGI26_000264 [Coemansia sp. RSA 1358]KAJ2680926.1 hypothetical protein GGI25_000230 [Coemansia spiralis]
MDSVSIPSENTYMLLARQGYAAQSRRRSVNRSVRSPDDMPFGRANRDSQQTLLSMEDDSFGSIDMLPSSAKSTTTFGSSSCSPLFIPSPSDSQSAKSISSSPSFSPHSPHSLLHDRLSAQIKYEAIEEADGDDGVVIHNGIRRLSLSAAGGLVHGRPRLVNM